MADGREISLVIADAGPGIAAADLPHVFDSFYRAQARRSTASATGLGLAIARGLIDAIGGNDRGGKSAPGCAGGRRRRAP